MNEQIPQQGKAEPIIPASPAQRKASVADVFSRISFTHLILIMLVMVFVWQWLDGRRTINDMQQQLARKLAELNGSKADQMLLTQSQEQMRELSAKVLTLETRYAEAQNQRDALEALYNELAASRDETVLAEVEQMLLIAEQHLQLSANVKAALIAVQSADARLQRLNRPAFNGLRNAIAQDLDKLRALPSVDITSINLRISNLIAVVDGLPLAYQPRAATEAVVQAAPPQDETAWQKLLREIWQEAKQLMRIENTEKAEIPLLAPSQEYFLRENLKLRLLAARIALLTRDEVSYNQELRTAQLWVQRYSDRKSGDSVRMLEGLKKLAAYDIGIELPDISPSLQAVRNFKLTRDKAAR